MARFVTDYTHKSSFTYWFAHWCAFQMTALNLGVWKFKYLFHDIEKPWLMLLWKDYPRVQKWHRTHNKHHLQYYESHKKCDWLALVIDWECSRLTKAQAPMTVRETLEYELNVRKKPYMNVIKENVLPIINKLGI